MRITYQLTPDDFYQGCIGWRRWLLRIAYFVVGAALLVSLLTLAVDRSPSIIPTALGGVGFGIVWFAYMFLAPRFFAGRQIQK